MQKLCEHCTSNFVFNKGLTLSILLCLQCVRQDNAINYNEASFRVKQISATSVKDGLRYERLRLLRSNRRLLFKSLLVQVSRKQYLRGKVGILRNKGMGLTASPRVPPAQEQAARSAWLGWGVQGSSLQFLFFFLLGFGWSPQLCQKFIFSKALQ